MDKIVRSPLSAVLDAAERGGKLNLRTSDIAQALPGVSADALRQALHRQQRKGRIVSASRGSEHWVIVPLQDASAGAPPLEAWLDAYLSKTLGLPYYVGLLSAAEVYGASPQAVMVTQVMVPKARRPVEVGRHRLVFFERSRIPDMPTVWHETMNGRYKVSSPALTGLELVARQQMAGGIARVMEVLQGLIPDITSVGLSAALDALDEIPTAQRIGVLLMQANQPNLADLLATWLESKRTRRIALSPGVTDTGPCTLDARFKVVVPDTIQQANT
jgi:predicted transcriptional regulator of viral defense system